MIMCVLCVVVHMRSTRRRGSCVGGRACTRQGHALIVDATVHGVQAHLHRRLPFVHALDH
jgi:hypothetical protein